MGFFITIKMCSALDLAIDKSRAFDLLHLSTTNVRISFERATIITIPYIEIDLRSSAINC